MGCGARSANRIVSNSLNLTLAVAVAWPWKRLGSISAQHVTRWRLLVQQYFRPHLLSSSNEHTDGWLLCLTKYLTMTTNRILCESCFATVPFALGWPALPPCVTTP